MLEHAVAAVDLLDADTPESVRTDHLLGLADALGACGAYDDAIRRYEEVAKLAEQSGDGYMPLRVLNNLAFTQYQAGMGVEAVITVERLLAQAAADGQPLQSHDIDTIARAYTAVGRYDDAIRAALQLVCEEGRGRRRRLRRPRPGIAHAHRGATAGGSPRRGAGLARPVPPADRAVRGRRARAPKHCANRPNCTRRVGSSGGVRGVSCLLHR